MTSLQLLSTHVQAAPLAAPSVSFPLLGAVLALSLCRVKEPHRSLNRLGEEDSPS